MATVVIARPREQIFDYLSDIANHAEFTAHYLTDWHLTREVTTGYGAGARFRIKAPLQRFAWGDATLVELQRPHRLVARGRYGKFNRILTLWTFQLEPTDYEDETRVRFTYQSQPKLLSDRLLEALGGRRSVKRNSRKSLARLRTILEQGGDRGSKPSISGGARKPASAFTMSAAERNL